MTTFILRKNVRKEVEDKIAELMIEHCDETIMGINLTAEVITSEKWYFSQFNFKITNCTFRLISGSAIFM